LCPMSGYFNYWHILLPGGFCQEQNFPAGQSSWSQKSCGLSDQVIGEIRGIQGATKSGLAKLWAILSRRKTMLDWYKAQKLSHQITVVHGDYELNNLVGPLLLSIFHITRNWELSTVLNAWKIQGASVLQLGQLASAQVGTPLDLSGGADLQIYSPINQMPIHITSDELLKPYCGLIGKGYSLVNWDLISQKIAAPIAKGQTSSA
ncbi:hypothetical protein PSTT_07769, partial [Puccinia striiformis]